MLHTPPYGYWSDYLWWWVVFASVIVHTFCFLKLSRGVKRRRLRVVLGNLLVTLCLLCFAGAVAETYLRFLHMETDAYGLTLTSRRWLALYPRLNSAGYRDREWTKEKAPAARRIAFVGDSFTFGWGIKRPEDRFTDLIQNRFRDRGKGHVQVMNVACGGWETGDQINAVWQMIEAYDVDEIVLCYCPNDIDDLLPPSLHEQTPYPPKTSLINIERSYLLDFLYVQLVVRRSSGVRGYFDRLAQGYRDSESWRIQCLRFNIILQACRDNDVTLRVALLPTPRYSGQLYDPTIIHEQVGRFFRAQAVAVVDLLSVMRDVDPRLLVVNRQDYHPNEKAHALFAEAIWNGLWGARRP